MNKIFDDKKRALSIVTWKDIRKEVLAVNKELGDIIDGIDPGDDYKFIKSEYLYGDIFIKNGEARLPSCRYLLC